MLTDDPRRSLVKRKPTSTTELRIGLAHLSSDLKYSNALPLRLRVACVPYALRPTDEFDAPSVQEAWRRVAEVRHLRPSRDHVAGDLEIQALSSIIV